MPLAPRMPLDLPAPPPPVRSLLGSARPVPGGWPGGREGSAVATQAVCPDGRTVVFDPCELQADPDTQPPRDGREVVRVWQPFVAQAADTCSTTDWQREGPERARDYLRADRSRQVAREFWTGEVTQGTDWHADAETLTNLWLADDDNVEVLDNDPVGYRSALGLLEQALGGCPGQSFIHTTPYVATLWTSLGLIAVRGSDLVTVAMGTVVIADGGYPGTGPGDTGSAPADEHWAFGTSTVYQLQGPIVVTPDPAAGDPFSQAVTWRQNRVDWTADAITTVLWDGCCHVGVAVDLTTP